VLRALDAGSEECSAVVKSTVLRAIKAGRISGTKDEQGEWHVEPAELHRVYPPRPGSGSPPGRAPFLARRFQFLGSPEPELLKIMSGATITVVVARPRIAGRYTAVMRPAWPRPIPR
jgi:hypothetical protein